MVNFALLQNVLHSASLALGLQRRGRPCLSAWVPANRFDRQRFGGAGNRALNGLTGLEAYLLDRVEPGATQQAQMALTMTGVQVGDTVTITGTVFTAASTIFSS